MYKIGIIRKNEWKKFEKILKTLKPYDKMKQIYREKILVFIIYKGIERDSYLQTSTGIQRRRLRALFERGDKGNTLELTG